MIQACIRMPINHKKSHELPVTAGILNKAKSELKHDITSLSLKMDSFSSKLESQDNKIDSLSIKVDSQEKKIDSLSTKIDSQDKKTQSQFEKVQSQFEDVKSLIMKVLLKVEEVDNRNKFVLDGFASLAERQEKDKVENDARFKNIENAVFSKTS